MFQRLAEGETIVEIVLRLTGKSFEVVVGDEWVASPAILGL